MMEGTSVTSPVGVYVLLMYLWLIWAAYMWGKGTQGRGPKSAKTPDEDPRE